MLRRAVRDSDVRAPEVAVELTDFDSPAWRSRKAFARWCEANGFVPAPSSGGGRLCRHREASRLWATRYTVPEGTIPTTYGAYYIADRFRDADVVATTPPPWPPTRIFRMSDGTTVLEEGPAT